MTVIAWDGETLAADKQCTNGVTKNSVTKIFRVNGCLVGVTGNLSVGMEMIEWFKEGAHPTAFPASNRDPDKGCSLAVVRPDKTLWEYESGPYPHQVNQRQMAWGSGDESALVAMYCGKSAEDAVRVTCHFNTTCGLGVDTLTLT